MTPFTPAQSAILERAKEAHKHIENCIACNYGTEHTPQFNWTEWNDILAALSLLDELAGTEETEPLYIHKKTGGLYERLMPMGRIQSSTPLHDMDEVAIYRAQKDGTLWARKASEFEDGRFEPARSNQGAKTDEKV